jgi:hypothetical protein
MPDDTLTDDAPYSLTQLRALPKWQTAPPAKRLNALNLTQRGWSDYVHEKAGNDSGHLETMRQIDAGYEKAREDIVADALGTSLATGKLTEEQVKLFAKGGVAGLERADPAAAAHVKELFPDGVKAPYQRSTVPFMVNGQGRGLMDVRVMPDNTHEVAFQIYDSQWNDRKPDDARKFTDFKHTGGAMRFEADVNAEASSQEADAVNTRRAIEVIKNSPRDPEVPFDMALSAHEARATRAETLAKRYRSPTGRQELALDRVEQHFKGTPELASRIGQWGAQAWAEQGLRSFLDMGSAIHMGAALITGDKDRADYIASQAQEMHREVEGMSGRSYRGGVLDQLAVGVANEAVPMVMTMGTSLASSAARKVAMGGAEAMADGMMKQQLTRGMAGKLLGTAELESQFGRAVADKVTGAVIALPSAARAGLDNWQQTMDAAAQARAAGNDTKAASLEDNATMNFWAGVGIETLSENIWLNEMWGTRAGRSLSKVSTEVLERRLGSKAGAIFDRVNRAVTEGLKNAGQEGLEEVIAGIGGRAWMNAFAEQNQDLVKDVPMELLTGAVIGGLAGTARQMMKDGRPELLNELLQRGLNGEVLKPETVQSILDKASKKATGTDAAEATSPTEAAPSMLGMVAERAGRFEPGTFDFGEAGALPEGVEPAEAAQFHLAQQRHVNSAAPAGSPEADANHAKVTVPETLATFAAQADLTRAGLKPATLFEGVQPADLPAALRPTEGDGTALVETPLGSVLYHAATLSEEQVKEAGSAPERIGAILGYGVTSKPEQASQVITLRNARGQEVASVVTDDAGRAGVTAALQTMQRDGDTLSSEPPELTLQRRQQAWFMESSTAKRLNLPRVSMSKGGKRRGLSEFWRRLAADPALTHLRGNASTAQDLPAILADYGLGGVTATKTDDGFRLDFPKQENQTRAPVAYVKHLKGGFVYVDTSGMADSGLRGGGDIVYQSAMTYAHNNGHVFRGDPNGVSEIARYRRVGHMLSSALRHQTTRHLQPYDEQGVDVPQEDWRIEQGPEDYHANVAVMADFEHSRAAMRAEKQGVYLNRLRYDEKTDTILDAVSGRSLSNQAFEDLLARLDARTSGIGKAALSRYLLTSRALAGNVAPAGALVHDVKRNLGAADGTAASGSDALPTGHQPARLFGGGHKPLYSRPPAGTRRGVTSAAAASALKLLQQGPAGKVVAQGVQIAANRNALDPSAYHPDDWADFESAEGFYDPSGKGPSVVLFTDNIEVRKGESAIQAVARTILHERVGHEGLRGLRAADPEFDHQWQTLIREISDDDLRAIAERYPEHAGDRAALAEEWFAHQVGELAAEQLPAAKSTLGKLWAAVRDMLRRLFGSSNFSADMVKPDRVNAQVREMAGLIQEAMRNGLVTQKEADARVSMAKGNPYTAQDLPLRVQQWAGITGAPFRVEALTARQILLGTQLPKALLPLQQQSARDAEAVKNTAAQLARDLDVAMESFATRRAMPIQAVNDMVNAVLSGQGFVHAFADEVLEERVRRVRNFLDDLSVAVGNVTGGNLGNTIMENIGAWMRRSYACFDPDSNWNYDNLRSAAQKGEQIAGRDAATIWNEALAHLQKEYPNHTDGQLEAVMRRLLDRDTTGMILTGRGGSISKDVSSLVSRREIPAPLRALMGEERNPVDRFLSSAGFQSQFIARHEQQVAMRELGLRLGLISQEQTGVFTHAVGGQSGGDNERWSGFAGVYATPELIAALQGAAGAVAGTDLSGVLATTLKFIGGEAKLNKVALNPDSWMVNILGNVVGLVSSGQVFALHGYQHVARAVGLMRAGRAKRGDVMNVAEEQLQDANRAFLERMSRAGVNNGGFTMQDLEATMNNRLHQFIEVSDRWDQVAGVARGALLADAFGRPFGGAGRVVASVIGGVAGGVVGGKRLTGAMRKVAEWTTSEPDRFTKLVSFLDNYEAQMLSGQAEEQAFATAAEKTLNTLPDYSRVPALMRQLSQLGLMGSFIAFQYEVYRNTFWNARYAFAEMASGKAPLIQRGARRFIGLSAVLGMAGGGLQALIQGLIGSGVDEEKDMAYRRALGSPWERHGRLAYTRMDDEGASFFNTSYLLPQVTLFEMIQAAREGQGFGEALGNAAEQLKDQFLNGSVHLDPLLEAWNNERRIGGNVSNAPDGSWSNYAQRLDYVLYTVMEPGAANKFDRILRSEQLMARPRYGRSFSLEEEAARLLGVRKMTYSHEDRIKAKLYEFRHRYEAARQYARSAYRENQQGAPDAALASSNAEIAKIQEDWQQFRSDLATVGVAASELERQRKSVAVPQRFAALVMSDTGPESARARTAKPHLPMPARDDDDSRARGADKVR